MAAGTRQAMGHALAAIATGNGQPVDTTDPRHPRVWLRRRGPHLPTVESFFAISPHTVADKVGPGFANAWSKATTSRPGPSLVIGFSNDLYALLNTVLQITGHSLEDAVVEALQDWIDDKVTDPDVYAKALANLDRQAQVLKARREALEVLAENHGTATGKPV